MICPYCHKKAKEVMRDEEEGYDDFTIEIVYQCTICGKEFILRLEKDGFYDMDDCPIED